MTECVKCHGKATLFLCAHCTVELRHQLLGLPTILAYLHDAVIGDIKLSGGGGRPPKGVQAQTMHYNRRAAALLEDIHNTIGQWARSLARTHGLRISAPINGRKIGHPIETKDYATFLAAHVDRLARDPDIAELCTSLRRYIHKAVGDDDKGDDHYGGGLTNRHVPTQFCGPCPALITDHQHCPDCGHRPHECATRLLAGRGALEVTCPACSTTHEVARLVNYLLARAEHFRCTITEMYVVLRMLDEPVPLKTLYDWTYKGKLKPAGYLRADKKNIGISRRSEADKPVYRVSDVRKHKIERQVAKSSKR